MMVNRRTFLKGIAGVLAIGAFPFFDRRVYHMKPGEVLDWINDPPWSAIHMADGCAITNCRLDDCQIIVPEGLTRIRIQGCHMTTKDRPAIKVLGPLLPAELRA